MAQIRNDAHLWASMIGPIKAAGVDDAKTLARVLVAVVRREQTTDVAHFGPRDDVPYDVIAVTDVDGDIWQRASTDPASGQRDHWKIPGYDPAEHDGAAAGVYVTPALLLAYGPVTAQDDGTRSET